MCWDVKETPYVQEVYKQTDGEGNAYERTYTHAQAEVAILKVPFPFPFSVSVSVSVSGPVSVSGSVSVVRGIAPYLQTAIHKAYDLKT